MEAYTKYLIQGAPFGLSDSLDRNFEVDVLSKYVNLKLISLQNLFSDKADCLNSMIDELEKRKLVLPTFRKSVLREDIGNTNLESGVALPHADQRRFLSLTLKKSINWEIARLIIMVNLSEEDLQERFAKLSKNSINLLMRKRKLMRL